MKQFTDGEVQVLKSMFETSKGNGHDFGLIEQVKVTGMTGRQVGGTIRELHNKIDFQIEDEEVNGVHQFVVQDWQRLGFDDTFESWLGTVGHKVPVNVGIRTKSIANNPAFHSRWEELQARLGSLLSAAHAPINRKDVTDAVELSINALVAIEKMTAEWK